jgi:hypothetical protein
MKRFLMCLLVLCIPVTSFAADPFKLIVKAIEQEYGVRHQGIPWVARVVMKPVLWGSGVSGLKLAEWENVSFAGEGSHDRLVAVIERTVGPEWQQVVRSRSRREGESTYIYVRATDAKLTMLIVNVEPAEAEVVQVNLSPKQLEQWMEDKDELAMVHHKRRKSEGRAGRDRTSEVLISSNTPGGYGMLVP